MNFTIFSDFSKLTFCSSLVIIVHTLFRPRSMRIEILIPTMYHTCPIEIRNYLNNLTSCNCSTIAWKMGVRLLFSPVCWNIVCLTENYGLHNASCNYFGLQGVALSTLTKTAISRLEIIVQRCSRSFDSSQNALRNRLPENSGRGCSEHISSNSRVFRDNPRIKPSAEVRHMAKSKK